MPASGRWSRSSVWRSRSNDWRRCSRAGREEFALRLACRTLDVLRDSALFQGLIAVTPDPRVAAEAAARGAEVVDDGDIALNAACTLGIARAAERGADVCVLMPSDLALLTPQSLAEVIEHYRALRDRSGPESIGLVRCKDGTGTNMVLLDPQRGFEPAFGADSFARHLQGSPGHAHEMIAPAISFDIDSPADLAALRRRRSAMRPTRSRNWFGPWRFPDPGRSHPTPTPGAARRHAISARARPRCGIAATAHS